MRWAWHPGGTGPEDPSESHTQTASPQRLAEGPGPGCGCCLMPPGCCHCRCLLQLPRRLCLAVQQGLPAGLQSCHSQSTTPGRCQLYHQLLDELKLEPAQLALGLRQWWSWRSQS